MKLSDGYLSTNILNITAAAQKRAIAARKPAPPVPMAVLRSQLAAKRSRAAARSEVSALLASGAEAARRARGPRSVIVASGLRSDHVSLTLGSSPEIERLATMLRTAHRGEAVALYRQGVLCMSEPTPAATIEDLYLEALGVVEESLRSDDPDIRLRAAALVLDHARILVPVQ